uniref:Uncharacterized protein LOC100375770 n=1 Tax=Saccoglossus kowalevskii TaxID=10224 RepID=A0ABM0ME23_SACKO|nr:PREDICTED: uncharacterized protein LOC100375770 [Saccoglossus kowalevskii]
MSESSRSAPFKASWLYGHADLNSSTKSSGDMTDITDERGFTDRKDSSQRLSVTYANPPSVIVEEKDTKEGRVGCYAISKEYMNNTTAHGIPRVIQSKSTCGRIMWSLICVCALTAFLVQSSLLIIQYLEYQVNNKVIKHTWLLNSQII